MQAITNNKRQTTNEQVFKYKRNTRSYINKINFHFDAKARHKIRSKPLHSLGCNLKQEDGENAPSAPSSNGHGQTGRRGRTPGNANVQFYGYLFEIVFEEKGICVQTMAQEHISSNTSR